MNINTGIVALTQQFQVLLVDDHEDMRESLAAYLRRFDFVVECVRDGVAMRQRLSEGMFDLVILELSLPGENGLSLCRFASQELALPVILLAAMADVSQRIVGLETGADDFLCKPFEPRELVARMHCVLRRTVLRALAPSSAEPKQTLCFAFAGWRLDVTRRELLDPAGKSVQISTAEFYLLRALVENSTCLLSRTQLISLMHKDTTGNLDRNIDSQISRLRKKLEVDPRHPDILKTVRGIGYILAVKVERCDS